jgi:hypothetical protein
LFGAFGEFNETAGDSPFAFAWFVSSFYESNLAFFDYNCADAYNWLVRVQPLHRITPLQVILLFVS